MNNKELEKHWSEFCSDFREVPEKGLCAIHRFIFTFGIVTNLNEISYAHKWCFDTKEEALIALKHWDGKGDPLGLWKKYKGENGEYSNSLRSDFNKKYDRSSPHLK